MRSANRSNALLVELLIVILFFMIASTILIQVFAAARQQSAKAEVLSNTLSEAQNIADRLYASSDGEELLRSLGFTQNGELWVLEEADHRVEASITEQTGEYGVYRQQEVRVTANGETLFTLPCSRWQGVSQ